MRCFPDWQRTGQWDFLLRSQDDGDGYLAGGILGTLGIPGSSTVRVLVSGWILGGAGMLIGNLERAHC